MNHYGQLVPGIAVAQVARRQIEHANEEGDEDVGLVVAASRFVEPLHDVCRIVLAGSDVAEEGLRDSHDECRGNALAADISDAEEKLAVPQECIVKVATHSLCRYQSAFHTDIAHSLQRRFVGRQKRLWYVSGNTKLALHAFLLQSPEA